MHTYRRTCLDFVEYVFWAITFFDTLYLGFFETIFRRVKLVTVIRLCGVQERNCQSFVRRFQALVMYDKDFFTLASVESNVFIRVICLLRGVQYNVR